MYGVLQWNPIFTNLKVISMQESLNSPLVSPCSNSSSSSSISPSSSVSSIMTMNHRGCPPSQQQNGIFGRSPQSGVQQDLQQQNYGTSLMNGGGNVGNNRMTGYNYSNSVGSVPPVIHHNMINSQQPQQHLSHHHHQNPQHHLPQQQLSQYPQQHVHATQTFGGVGGNAIQPSSSTENVCGIKNGSNGNLNKINNNGSKVKQEYSVVSTTTAVNNNNVIQAVGNNINNSNNGSAGVNSTNGSIRSACYTMGPNNNEYKYHGNNNNNNNSTCSPIENNNHVVENHASHNIGFHHPQLNQVVPFSCYRPSFQDTSSFSLEEATGGSTSSSSFPDTGEMKPDLNGIELPHSTFKSEVRIFQSF